MKQAKGLCWLSIQGGNDLFPRTCAHLMLNVTVLLHFQALPLFIQLHTDKLCYSNVFSFFWLCFILIKIPNSDYIGRKKHFSLTITEV